MRSNGEYYADESTAALICTSISKTIVCSDKHFVPQKTWKINYFTSSDPHHDISKQTR